MNNLQSRNSSQTRKTVTEQSYQEQKQQPPPLLCSNVVKTHPPQNVVNSLNRFRTVYTPKVAVVKFNLNQSEEKENAIHYTSNMKPESTPTSQYLKTEGCVPDEMNDSFSYSQNYRIYTGTNKSQSLLKQIINKPTHSQSYVDNCILNLNNSMQPVSLLPHNHNPASRSTSAQRSGITFSNSQGIQPKVQQKYLAYTTPTAQLNLSITTNIKSNTAIINHPQLNQSLNNSFVLNDSIGQNQNKTIYVKSQSNIQSPSNNINNSFTTSTGSQQIQNVHSALSSKQSFKQVFYSNSHSQSQSQSKQQQFKIPVSVPTNNLISTSTPVLSQNLQNVKTQDYQQRVGRLSSYQDTQVNFTKQYFQINNNNNNEQQIPQNNKTAIYQANQMTNLRNGQEFKNNKSYVGREEHQQFINQKKTNQVLISTSNSNLTGIQINQLLKKPVSNISDQEHLNLNNPHQRKINDTRENNQMKKPAFQLGQIYNENNRFSQFIEQKNKRNQNQQFDQENMPYIKNYLENEKKFQDKGFEDFMMQKRLSAVRGKEVELNLAYTPIRFRGDSFEQQDKFLLPKQLNLSLNKQSIFLNKADIIKMIDLELSYKFQHFDVDRAMPQKYVLKYTNNCKYEGHLSQSTYLREGKGNFSFSNGYQYDGDWNHDKLNGIGTLSSASGRVIYEGEFKDNQFDGKGIFYQLLYQTSVKIDYRMLQSQDTYLMRFEGQFKNNMRDGFGLMYFSSGERYFGTFENDVANGMGIFQSDKEKINGEWKAGFFIREKLS